MKNVMKWIAGIAILAVFGLLEGSDVQGFEITSSMWILMFLTTIMAGSILLKGDNE